MKVRASVKKMCRNCKIVKREGVVRVLCLSLIHIQMCIRDSRVGFRFEDGKKVRFFKSNNEII